MSAFDEMHDLRNLEELFDARTPIIAVESHEEQKVLALLEQLARLNERRLFVWSVTRGLRESGGAGSIYNTARLTDALNHIGGAPDGIYVLVDAHAFLDDPVVLRAMRDVAARTDAVHRLLVLLSPKIELPPELSRLASRFSPAPIDRRGVVDILREEARQWLGPAVALRGQQEALGLLAQHLAGLTEGEIRRMVRIAIRDDGSLTLADIDRILKAKHELLATGDVLSLETSPVRLQDVGGLSNLKRWLALRREVFLSGEASGLPPPKGLLLLGVQGAGKSLAAKAVAGSWHLPLFRLDFGALYNKFHGETERNLRELLRTAGAMAPCVLWIDEIEKGIAADSGDADGGVSQRVLGTLLTWMAERKERVFLVATANDVQRLPPELLRKGRFDEIFFVDLPAAPAREAIFAIQLARRKLDAADFDLPALAAGAEGFSGAEIEQALLSALYEAHTLKQAPSTGSLLRELARTRPLSALAGEKIDALRAWATGRTVPAD